jgi:hypothetical protein
MKHGSLTLSSFTTYTNVPCFRASTDIQVSGFRGGRQNGYHSLEDANSAWDHVRATGSVGPPPAQGSVPPRIPIRPLSSALIITDEDAHWVVNKGQFLGVYLGK